MKSKMHHEQVASHIFQKVSKRYTSEASKVRSKERRKTRLWIKHQKCCRSRPSHRANQSRDLSHVTAHPKLLISAKQPCKSFNQARPRDRATQSPDLHQAIVQMILPTRPCNRSPNRNRANHSESSSTQTVGCGHVHPCCHLRLCRQSTATFEVNISSVASKHQNLPESHVMQMTAPTHHEKIPTHHSRPTASQPCIDPPSVSEWSHQAEPLLINERKEGIQA